MKHVLRMFIVPSVCLAVSTGASVTHAQDLAKMAADEYAAGHYASALRLYETLALAGDAAAAEAAGQMLYYDAEVHGDVFAANPARAANYLGQAARAGRPVARHLLDRLIPPVAAQGEEEYVSGPAGC